MQEPETATAWHPRSCFALRVKAGHPDRRFPAASLGGADDPDGMGDDEEGEGRVAGDGEGDGEEVEGEVDAEQEADAVFDRDGEGWEDEGEDNEEEGGHRQH